ncbi:unnamed protein product [Trichogramma brassicae]|uniref:Uncharacterized protein n=1 Tax=Trichogramma brassicae TaxID=86971 RepID=A0A6H5HWQ7_9HYME|nr:unnamed protein product [Trichogramma brassicae]
MVPRGRSRGQQLVNNIRPSKEKDIGTEVSSIEQNLLNIVSKKPPLLGQAERANHCAKNELLIYTQVLTIPDGSIHAVLSLDLEVEGGGSRALHAVVAAWSPRFGSQEPRFQNAHVGRVRGLRFSGRSLVTVRLCPLYLHRENITTHDLQAWHNGVHAMTLLRDPAGSISTGSCQDGTSSFGTRAADLAMFYKDLSISI